jgi:hypothetical protein
MSIRHLVERLVVSGKLTLLPTLLGLETGRDMYVSAEILKVVTPPFASDDRESMQLADFRQFLDAFSERCRLTVAENPYVKPGWALMARIDPVNDEFFDLRVITPAENEPQSIRAFGGFADIDAFVALTWNYRDSIGDNFNAEVDRCRNAWRELFGEIRPHHGATLDDYLTHYRAV